MTELVSERLYFRNLTENDVSTSYVSWLNDPDVNRYLETRFTVQTMASCKQFVAETNRDTGSHFFGIFNKQSQQHIGNIKLGFIKTHHDSGQISLLIGEKSCWGKGYATESIRTVTKWGIRELDLKRIEAGCYDENLASLRAFLKCGYTVEGYFRKSHVVEDRRIGCFWVGFLKEEILGEE